MHSINHMWRIDNLRPSAKARDPSVKHIADFYLCLDGEVFVINLLILHASNAELVNYGVQLLVNKPYRNTQHGCNVCPVFV